MEVFRWIFGKKVVDRRVLAVKVRRGWGVGSR